MVLFMSDIHSDNVISDREIYEMSDVSSSDSLLSNLSPNNRFEYVIADRSMHYIYIYEDRSEKEFIFRDYRSQIKDMNLVYRGDEYLFDAFCDALEEGAENVRAEYRAISIDYKTTTFVHEGHLERDMNGIPEKIVGHCTDILRGEIDLGSAELNEGHDPLTNIYNGSKARSIIKNTILKATSEKKDISGALILIDIDGFNYINDTFGYMYGDVILQTIAGVIYTNFMKKDIVARISADQFMVFCDDIEESRVKKHIYDLQVRLSSNISLRNGKSITAGIGYSFIPKDAQSFYSLYSQADIALRVAKERGGNCAVAFDSDTMSLAEDGLTFIKNSWQTGIINSSIVNNSDIDKKLFDYAFETMIRVRDTTDAIYAIIKEVCLNYGYDRGVFFEKLFMKKGIRTTIKWSSKPDDTDFPEDMVMDDAYWDVEPESYTNSSYLVFQNGISEKFDYSEEIKIHKYYPVSAIHLPIFDGNQIKGLFNIECFNKHEFSQKEISTLIGISQIVSSYRLGKQVKDFHEAENIINKNVMEAQKVVFFVINRHTGELRYLSKQAETSHADCECGEDFFESVIGKKLKPVIEEMDYGSKGEKTAEYYDDINDAWYTITVKEIEDGTNANDILLCVTDVTDFLNRVKGEDTLTGAETYDSFVMTATRLIKNNDIDYQLLCLGIKEFAKINDAYGYVAGDEVLKLFTKIMQGNLKDGEMICRIKGDDFLMLVQKDIERDIINDVSFCSIRMNRELKDKYPGINIRCFAGLYDMPKNGENINRCVDNAIKARNMVLNDRDRNFFKYTHEIEIKEHEEEVLKEKIKKSLENGGFVVFFQPKVDIIENKIVGAEALVRLNDDGKILPPGVFIPVAEKTGMVVDIDKKVYEQTFRLISMWKADGKDVPLISINVSRVHLIDNRLPERMLDLANKYGLDPSSIELEITESVFFEDTERLIEMIKRLKQAGFSISMDDFGSGYSTLNFMKDLPADIVKIDGGFFMQNELDDRSRVIISAILHLADNLEFESVSEGVETEEQVSFIKSQGGRIVQGYYFYKPMPAEEFGELLK